MHKIVASLLLVVAATALLTDYPATAASPTVRISAQAVSAGSLWNREDAAAQGEYFDLALGDGLQVSYRLAEVGADTASIDAIVIRDGVTLSEPSLEIELGSSASVHLDTLPLDIVFRVDAG